MKDQSLPLPPSDTAHSRDAIAAEIADHLAAAEAELAKRGATTTEAQAAARQKFGDVEKIQKTCYWIQNGETIMLRWTLIALASALCLLLGLSVLGNWRTQSQLAEEMGKLSAELKALAAAKQAPPPAPQPPEITGVIYAGSKDKPVANAGIAVIKTDKTVVRRFISDEKGRYRSGPLEAGDYCITTDTVNPPDPPSDSSIAAWVTQSQPVLLHSGSESVSMDLDAAFHSGTLTVSASRPLPEVHRLGKYYLTSRLNVFVKMPRKRPELWSTTAQDTPTQWPIFAAESQATGYNRPGSETALFKLKANEEVPYVGHSVDSRSRSAQTVFAAGDTQISAMVLVSIFPTKGEEESLAKDPTLSPRYRLDEIERQLEKDRGWGWWNSSNGKLWRQTIVGPTGVREKSSFSSREPRRTPKLSHLRLQTISIAANTLTRLRAEIPEGIAEEIEAAIAKVKTVEEFDELVEQGLFSRPVTLAVIGHEKTISPP